MRIILTLADCLSPTDRHSTFGLEIPWTKTTFRSVEILQDCTRDFSDPLCKGHNYNNSKMISFCRNAQVTLVEKPQLKRIRFQIYIHWYLMFNDVIVNRALPSVDKGSLENLYHSYSFFNWIIFCRKSNAFMTVGLLILPLFPIGTLVIQVIQGDPRPQIIRNLWIFFYLIFVGNPSFLYTVNFRIVYNI